MKKKDLLLFLGFLLMSFFAWFFPKPIEPVLFLGFSHPVVIGHAEQEGQGQGQRKTASFKESGSKAQKSRTEVLSIPYKE